MPNPNYTSGMSATPQNPRPTVYVPGQYASQPNSNPGGFSAATDPSARGPNPNSEDERRKRQLMVRRRIDDKIRYGQPVSDQEMAEARRIGAV